MAIRIALLVFVPSLLLATPAVAELDTATAPIGQTRTPATTPNSDAFARGLIALQATDYLGAAAEFQEAAGQGDASAMRHLGDMAFAGMGLAQSYDRAIHWYCRAALAADRDAVARLQSVDLMSWSTQRDALGWKAACRQWLKPPAPGAQPQSGQSSPEVNININVQPERERRAPTVIWPGYVPRHWRPQEPPHRPQKPIRPPLAPYPSVGIGR